MRKHRKSEGLKGLKEKNKGRRENWGGEGSIGKEEKGGRVEGTVESRRR